MNDHTFNTDAGGFSNDNEMSLDQRGFKTLIQAEASSFLHPPNQILLGATVREIAYSTDGVRVRLDDGRTLSANYSICTFRCVTIQSIP